MGCDLGNEAERSLEEFAVDAVGGLGGRCGVPAVWGLVFILRSSLWRAKGRRIQSATRQKTSFCARMVDYK